MNNTEIWRGTFTGGATYKIRKVISRVPLLGLSGANKLMFDIDPKLATNDKLLVAIPDAVDRIRNWNDYLTVTTAAVKVGNIWEVVTDGNWAIVKEILTFDGSCCGVVNVNVEVCAPLDITKFSGEVYSRPVNGNKLLIPASVSPDSANVTLDTCFTNLDCGNSFYTGDAIYLENTAIDRDNPATIVDVLTGKDMRGKSMPIVTLDRPVTGLTGVVTNLTSKVNAVIYRKAVKLTFRAVGDWEIEAVLASTVSSSSSFPGGKLTANGQEYRFTIAGDLGSGFVSGTLLLV